jgi:MtN3 and saliva related transmembrane protein
MTFGWPIDFIGAAGATLTTLCWLPQAIKVIREKETRALSSMDSPSMTGR